MSNRPAPPRNTLRRISEGELVCGIAAWLDGEPWTLDDAQYRPYHGLNIKLRLDGEALVHDKVPILTRNPAAVIPYEDRAPFWGTGATNRAEARSICEVALRGDVGMYRSLPTKQAPKLAA